MKYNLVADKRKEKKLMVYFYPNNEGGVCTKEA
jgi:peroxiredoxin